MRYKTGMGTGSKEQWMRQENWNKGENGWPIIVWWGWGNLYCIETGATRVLPGFSYTPSSIFKVNIKCFKWTYMIKQSTVLSPLWRQPNNNNKKKTDYTSVYEFTAWEILCVYILSVLCT